MGMWVQQVPVWKEIENWRARQQAIDEQISSLATVTESFSGAGSNYYTQLGNLSANAALKRVQDAAKAKQAEALEDAAKKAREQAEMDAIKERLKVPDYVRIITPKVNITA